MIDTTGLGYRWGGAHDATAQYQRGDVVLKDGRVQRFDGTAFITIAEGQASATAPFGLLRAGTPAPLFATRDQELAIGPGGLPRFAHDAGRRGTAAMALAQVDFGNAASTIGPTDTNLALMRDGTVAIWGAGLGAGPAANRVQPARIGFPEAAGRITKLFAIRQTFYAIDEFGQLWGWGVNANGQLGIGSTLQIDRPVLLNGRGDLPANARIREISAGASYSAAFNALAISEEGEVWFAGANTTSVASGIPGTPTGNIIAWARIPLDVPIRTALTSGDANRPGTALIDTEGRVWFAGSAIFASNINNTAGTYPTHALWSLSTFKPVRAVKFQNNLRPDGVGGYLDNEYGSGVVFEDGTIATRIAAARLVEIRDPAFGSFPAHQFIPDSRITGVRDLLVFGGSRELAIALKHDGTVWATGAKGDLIPGYPNTNLWQQLVELGAQNIAMQGVAGVGTKALGFQRQDGSVAFIGNANSGHFGNGQSTTAWNGPAILPGPAQSFSLSGTLFDATNSLVSTFLMRDGALYTAGFGGGFMLGNDPTGNARLTPSVVLT
jgi:hypothetical protein